MKIEKGIDKDRKRQTSRSRRMAKICMSEWVDEERGTDEWLERKAETGKET